MSSYSQRHLRIDLRLHIGVLGLLFRSPFFPHRTFALNLRAHVAVLLALFIFLAPLAVRTSAQTSKRATRISKADHFVFHRGQHGEFSCRAATPIEESELEQIRPRDLRKITHVRTPSPKTENATAEDVDNLTIILLGTAQLNDPNNANAVAAKAAFIRAAQIWEALIKSPITIYIDVDYGSTNFGQPWSVGVIGSTSAPTFGGLYDTVRNQLIAGASKASETPLYNSLQTGSLPTNQGNASSLTVAQTIGRAIGLLPANAPDPGTGDTTPRPRIAFNSAFSYDFDPSDGSDGPGGDGIDSGKTDFEAVAVHELGHALGFTSRAGRTSPTNPAVWDIFRFRSGTTLGTFGTAERIMTADGLQFYFSGPGDLPLSTGGADGGATGGDGRQSSHWKDDALTGNYVGIMDPTLSAGVRRQLTVNDTLALDSFGYNLDNNNPPPPPPPPPSAPANNDFASAQMIFGCFGSVNGTNVEANKEIGEPSHSPDGNAGGRSVWYEWKAPSNGSVTITTAGSNYDTLLAVYTGNDVGALTAIAKNDDVQLGVILTSSVTFSATADATYQIAVDGWGGDSGSITLNWTKNGCPSNAIDTVAPVAGRSSGGQQVVLTGSFANLSSVNFGGSPATFSYTNGTSEITVTTPSHVVGAVDINLVPPSGPTYSKTNAFAYLPTVFTDDTLVVGQTTARAQHIIELRQAVDALREVAGDTPAAWTDATLSPFSMIIKAVHIQELRTNLDAVALQLGYSTSPYTDPSLGAGVMIKRIHIEELRQRIRNIAG